MASDRTAAPRRRTDLPAIAERLWRPLLGLAVTLFAACGPVHAVGHTDLVYHLVLAGLAASAVAIPLGLLGLRHVAAAEAEPADGADADADAPGDPALSTGADRPIQS